MLLLRYLPVQQDNVSSAEKIVFASPVLIQYLSLKASVDPNALWARLERKKENMTKRIFFVITSMSHNLIDLSQDQLLQSIVASLYEHQTL